MSNLNRRLGGLMFQTLTVGSKWSETLRHWVNFGLLYAFLTLAVSGVLSFFQPFSITTTRVHVWSAVATILLVGMHLAVRLRYFRSQLKWNTADDPRPGRRIPKWGLALVTTLWLGLLFLAWLGRGGTARLMTWSYEARHRAEIVRAEDSTGLWDDGQQLLVSRRPDRREAGRAQLTLKVLLNGIVQDQRMAIWTESTTGSMIETLYLSPELAYSDQPTWQGQTVSRDRILPIWRHRYSLVSGVEPDGTVDAFSGATASHQFTLEDYLVIGEAKEFVLCVEVNAPGDANRDFEEPLLGQPSVLYTALIEMDQEQRYWLLSLTGRGGNTEDGGAIQYDLDSLTSARQLVELLLVKVQTFDGSTTGSEVHQAAE